MLTPEEYKSKLTSILDNAGDPGRISEILTGLHEDYNATVSEQTELTLNVTKLKEMNDSLVKSNGELFRYVGLYKEEPEKEPEKEPDTDKKDLPTIDEVMEKILPNWGVK